MILKFDGQAIETMRSLPRAVAATPIGKAIHSRVLCARARPCRSQCDGRPAARKRTRPTEPEPSIDAEQAEEPDHEDLLGLSMAPLTDDLRSQFHIGKGGGRRRDHRGRCPTAPRRRKYVKPGDVIVEVTQERVTDPQEVLARIEAVKKSGRKSVLLLISDAKGGLRFVAVPVA